MNEIAKLLRFVRGKRFGLYVTVPWSSLKPNTVNVTILPIGLQSWDR